MRSSPGRTILGLLLSLALCAQVPPGLPPGFGPRAVPEPQQQPPKPEPAKPAPQAAPPAPPQPETPAGERRVPTGTLSLQNASLTEVIDALARQLGINYILDPRVKGSVTLNTYGEIREIDTRSLLDMILRINGATMVKVGDLYRIVPLSEAPRLPIPPQTDVKEIPEDDQIMLNLIFLKYVTVEELSKLIEPFIGEGAQTWAYTPANLLLILDSRRNMRRTMELVALFDSDTLAGQRIRVYEVQHGRPTEIVSELERVLGAISLSKDQAPIKFLPVDRLNLIIAVAPNPGAFEQVESWIKRFDQPVKVTAGAVDNYVYRVKYGRAEALAMAIMSLYSGLGPWAMMGFGGMYGLFSGAAAGFGNPYVTGGGFGMMGGYGMPGVYGGYGMPGAYGMGGYAMSPYGMGGYGMGGYGMYGPAGFGGYGMGYGGFYPGAVAGPGVGMTQPPGTTRQATGAATAGQEQRAAAAPSDLTGSYLGMGGGWGAWTPRIVPNPFDNTILIQGTPQEYQQVRKLLDELDIPPRQVLIEAKIYEVSLTGAFRSGVSAFLQRLGATPAPGAPSASRQLTGTSSANGLSLSIATLVGKSRELLAFLETQEVTSRAKVISAPSVLATDSIPASINVGTEVPTLAAQAVSPIQSGGTSLFTNSIQNRNSGVTLQILARVNPSGIVTLIINQEVSAPQPPPAGGIQSPSFTKRTVQTQVTLNDGDTIAIGGIINESATESSAGVPYLHRLPVLGSVFGSKSKDRERTELVVFMTPRVVYDLNQVVEASEELKSRFRRLSREIRNLE